VSLSGTFMQSIAQDWLVLKLTNSGTALGLVTALQFLPILLLAPLGGVIADRYSKRKILYFTQTAFAFLAIVLGLLIYLDSVTIWMVYVLAFGLGLVSCIDGPTRHTFIIEMVGKNELKNAVTLYASEVNLARVIGPLAAGTIIATIGLALCFIINGISYIAVIAGLYMMNEKELSSSTPTSGKKGHVIEGIKYALATPVLRNTLILIMIIGTLTYEFQVSLPLLAQFTFNGDASTYAVLTAAISLGAVIGGLLIAGRKITSQSLLVKSAFFFGASVILSSIMRTYFLTVGVLVVVGFASIYFISLANSILQLESSAEMRGRVMSFWSIAFLGSSAIGGPIIGAISEIFGPRVGLSFGGFAAIFAGVIGLMLIRSDKQTLHKTIN
jgi:MFS family permease